MARNKVFRFLVRFFLAVFLLSVLLTVLFYFRVRYSLPAVPDSVFKESERVQAGNDYYVLGNNWLRKNKNGNWECYVEGPAYERGRILGILQKELIENQESVFIDEINAHISSKMMQKFLMIGISWFNRDLDKNIPGDIRQEIYGVSEFFSDKYDNIGPKYNRILNYHAAHDIGHAVQNMHIVACTAFGTWGASGVPGPMVFGRNFDFYFGDAFAKNKIVLFCRPDSGYAFMSVTWAGFCGVVSGINEKGLGITLNADKSEIPEKSGTPVSVIAREILQYASNFDEAIAISRKYNSFVSESFTIVSASDSSVMVIEKTPDTTGLYYPSAQRIIVTNHFQSPALKDLPINIKHIGESESLKRFQRVDELLSQFEQPDVNDILGILRDRKGLGGKDIGLGNPEAINQLLAHHAVIFKPYRRLAWVSNYPFQEGVFNAYDLNDFWKWKAPEVQFPVSIDSLELPADTFLQSEAFVRFGQYKQWHAEILNAMGSDKVITDDFAEEFMKSNPEYYETYRVLGLYYRSRNDLSRALIYFRTALTKEIPYMEDRKAIEESIHEIERK